MVPTTPGLQALEPALLPSPRANGWCCCSAVRSAMAAPVNWPTGLRRPLSSSPIAATCAGEPGQTGRSASHHQSPAETNQKGSIRNRASRCRRPGWQRPAPAGATHGRGPGPAGLAIDALVEAIGTDSAWLESELRKLSLRDTSISAARVQELVGGRSTNAWPWAMPCWRATPAKRSPAGMP